jgi:predicted DsbA family dithiol-disulfide isomerase
MTQALRIDVISDIACPWCAIGLSSLQIALSRLEDVVDADIVVHPFELNPDMPPEGEAVVDYLGRKYGRTPQEIAESQAMIRERGASVGFEFGPRTQVYNTFDAHRLLHWAGLEGKQLPLKLSLLRAYHGEGRNPGDRDVLIELAQAAGLDPHAAAEVLQSGAYTEEVRAAERQNEALGIHSVPAIILDQRYLVNGGQPPEVFEQAIRQALAEETQ